MNRIEMANQSGEYYFEKGVDYLRKGRLFSGMHAVYLARGFFILSENVEMRRISEKTLAEHNLTSKKVEQFDDSSLCYQYALLGLLENGIPFEQIIGDLYERYGQMFAILDAEFSA
jgi:hypothetical protein